MLIRIVLSAALIASLASCRAPDGPHEDGETAHLHDDHDHDHDHELGGPVEVTTPPLTRIREFHGHLGPYVILGYRMGLLAREILDSPGYFDLDARIETPLAPPPSCLVDGLQLGSGCTAGKRNLTVVEGAIARATFTTMAGKTVVIALRQDLPEKIRTWIAESGVDAAGRKVLDLPEEEAFSVEASGP